MTIDNLELEENVGLFSDIHIGIGQNSSVWHENIIEFGIWAREIYLKNKIKTIIIPGDIFHNRNEISVQTLNVGKRFFDIFKDFKIVISTGNHDCYYKDRSDINSISIFNNWPNIFIVDEIPKTILSYNKKISFIPWGCALDEIPESDICFGHFEINSFKYNSYAVCEHGITSSDLLKKSRLIISGHFHSKDEREYSNGKIVYLGSPFQQNFGDISEERGIYIFNLKKETLKFIPNNVSPQHIKISLKNILENKIPKNYIQENVTNNMVCLVVDANDFTNKINIISSQIQELKPKFFRVDYKIDNIDNSLNVNSTDEYSHLNIVKSMEDFVNNLNTSHKSEVFNYLQEKYNLLAR